MAIGVERDGHGRVAEAFGHDLAFSPARSSRVAAVPEIMEPDSGQRPRGAAFPFSAASASASFALSIAGRVDTELLGAGPVFWHRVERTNHAGR